MKASSESGECASLISIGCFSVFWVACRAAITFVVPRGLPARPAKILFPSVERGENERKRNLGNAGTCEAPCRVFFAQRKRSTPGLASTNPAAISPTRKSHASFCLGVQSRQQVLL